MKQDAFEKHFEYMQSVIPRLIEAENTIKEIKSSKQWLRSLNYFNVLYQRGYLTERPCSRNGYKIEKGNNKLVQLSDLMDILTDEQLEMLKNKSL